jgi:hypothetical protein
MKTLYATCIASVLLAPAGASAQDWSSWDDMVRDARKVPHEEAKVCKGGYCVTIIMVTADGHKAIMRRTKGHGVDLKEMCMDDKPCIPVEGVK